MSELLCYIRLVGVKGLEPSTSMYELSDWFRTFRLRRFVFQLLIELLNTSIGVLVCQYLYLPEW